MKLNSLTLHRVFIVFLFGSLAFSLTFCASTSELEEEEVEELLNRATEQVPMAVYVDLERYTSQLSDNYAMLHNTVPESFRDIEAEEERRNSNQGYRVQIISTRDLEEVETTESEFLTWMREEEITPRHETYIRFRQPYYRLHLGDFRSRAEAIEFSQVVRTQYPNAWVVPDQIDPDAIREIEEEAQRREQEEQEAAGREAMEDDLNDGAADDTGPGR